MRYGKSFQSVAAGLAGFLLAIVAFGQDSGLSVDTGSGGQTAKIDVRGVLISSRSRSALINGQVLRIGDYLGDLEIVAIDRDQVRIRAASRETGVQVGTSTSMDNLYWSSAAPELAETDQTAVASIMENTSDLLPANESIRRHEVRPGETLSEIAETYLVPGVRRHQLMIALFEANPHAFHGNINRMRAGVVLDLPDIESLSGLSPKTAMAKIMEQTDRWRSEQPRKLAKPKPAMAKTYGPVSSGESLSLIAHRLLSEGGSARALMSALYQANPHAFGGSMDMLREGAVLQIPGRANVADRTPASDTVIAQLQFH